MKTSPAGIALIKHFEGCRLTAYLDGAGIASIGYGHTAGVRMGDAITQEQADKYLADELAMFEHGIAELVKVPVTQGQWDALVSLTYNIGSGNLARSTLLKKLNTGDMDGCRREFPKWDMSAGVHVPGLLTRRMAEATMFANATPVAAFPDAPLLPPDPVPPKPSLLATILNLLASLFRK